MDHQAPGSSSSHRPADDSELRSRKAKAGENGTSSSAGRARSKSTPKLGVDYTQKQVELVARIRTCKDFYEILQVDKNASEDDIKRAYKKLALQLHPDKCRAPHSTEAFSALGSAYDVLSNEEKRHRYDMYGNEEAAPARQRQHHHHRHGDGYFQYDYSHGFQSDFTPEEIFNMFFGGVFPDEVMRRQRNQQFRRHFRPRPEEEEEEGVEAENGGGRYMLIIILVAIFMSYIAPFLNSLSAPPFSLRQNSDYPIRRDTANLRVPYFVQRDFMEHYSTEIRKIDKKVEEDYTYQLRVECYKEQQQKENMIYRARLFGDAELLKRGQQYNMPSCRKLEELYAAG